MTKYEYKCVRIKNNGLCKLIMNVCKKNVVLPREWAGIVVGIWNHHGMPRFECFSCSETAFVERVERKLGRGISFTALFIFLFEGEWGEGGWGLFPLTLSSRRLRE